MPRMPRRKSRTGIYHVILRGVNRQVIFEEEEDKWTFLRLLKRCKQEDNFELYSYCLMDNHVHLQIQEKDVSLSKTMHRICTKYVIGYNKKYERCGHLFQDRFKSEVVESIHSTLKVLKYIHKNPIRAGLSNDIFHCKWTSINDYIHTPKLVDTEPILQLFSKDNMIAKQSFITYMKEEVEEEYFPTYRKKDPAKLIKETLMKFGFTNSSNLLTLPKQSRDSIIVELKKIKGVSCTDISRLTGIPKNIVYRAK